MRTNERYLYTKISSPGFGGDPHVNAFRGKTFVIAFGGKAIEEGYTKTLAYDVNLPAALGIRLILVHGARPRSREELQEKGLPSNYHRGYRITDAATLDCVLDAVGSVYLEVEAPLSQGLPQHADGQCPDPRHRG